MTLEQLRVFVAVAERQHVTRAAEALNLAQSAVSAAIASIESRHGAKLFDRVGRGIELTEAGRLFLVEARVVLAQAEFAELVLSELGGLKRGTLTLEASQTIASFWLPRHLVAFRRAYPGIDIRLGVGNTAQVAAAVHAGTAELGFVEAMVEDSRQPTRGARSARRRGRSATPLGGRKKLAWRDLAGSEWVLREPGSGTRSVFEHALQGFGLSPGDLHVALVLPSNEAVRAAVEAGMGATAISASVVASSIEAGLLRLVPLKLPERQFHVLHHVERYRTRAADALLELIGRHG
jgi:DNA-binding transcriptional LysR family regulator